MNRKKEMEMRERVEMLFERNTIAEVLPSQEALVKHLMSGKPFHIYLGLDPTHNQIHLGHIQNILFLEDLRKLGCKVTLLFGSFTALVGDPTGKESTRKQLTPRDIKKNMRKWKRQVRPVLDISLFSNASVKYNTKWFNLFSFYDFLLLMRETTVQQLLERDMFQKRLQSGKPLYTHELVYPLLQGYDSVAMNVDAELCGTDQTFNALMGRTMLRKYRNKEKFVIAMRLIEADGVMMSKSKGTGVFVDMDTGGNHRMFGSIMALSDGFISPLFRGCTRVPIKEIQEMENNSGVALRDAKMRLACEIVKMFWGVREANNAKKAYEDQFQKKVLPENAMTISITDGAKILNVVVEHAAKSHSDAKRKFKQGAVSLDGEKITDINYSVKKKKEGCVLRVGRKIFRLM